MMKLRKFTALFLIILSSQVFASQEPCIPIINKKSQLRDPSSVELVEFLKRDQTDKKTYSPEAYDCKGFSLELRDNARDEGLRAAFVSLNYKDQNLGHAIVAFNTIDSGLVYIETQKDSVFYLEVDQKYGIINLDSIKRDGIDCSGDPKDFWMDLSTAQYEGSLFAYSYFEYFLTKVSFLKATTKLYNNEASLYDASLKDYKQHVGNYDDFIKRQNNDGLLRSLNDRIVKFNTLDSTQDRVDYLREFSILIVDKNLYEEKETDFKKTKNELFQKIEETQKLLNSNQIKLAQWYENILKLKQEVGTQTYIASDKILEKIEIYW
jgi:hypothetical protein